MSKIIIVDYGMGNLLSIQNMIKKLGQESYISGDTEVISKANKLILPGVGAFNKAMENLHSLDLIQILNTKVLEEKVPILGICLGMQIMTLSSEEGNCNGFGWFNAKTKRFKFEDKSLKIPHMGWNIVYPKETNSNLINSEIGNNKFYFVHSYYVDCIYENDISAISNYGGEFTCAIQKQNIYGVQFHPEKSHRYGMNLLDKFLKLR